VSARFLQRLWLAVACGYLAVTVFTGASHSGAVVASVACSMILGLHIEVAKLRDEVRNSKSHN